VLRLYEYDRLNLVHLTAQLAQYIIWSQTAGYAIVELMGIFLLNQQKVPYSRSDRYKLEENEYTTCCASFIREYELSLIDVLIIVQP